MPLALGRCTNTWPFTLKLKRSTTVPHLSWIVKLFESWLVWHPFWRKLATASRFLPSDGTMWTSASVMNLCSPCNLYVILHFPTATLVYYWPEINIVDVCSITSTHMLRSHVTWWGIWESKIQSETLLPSESKAYSFLYQETPLDTADLCDRGEIVFRKFNFFVSEFSWAYW